MQWVVIKILDFNEQIGMSKEDFVMKYKALVHSICKKYTTRAYGNGMEYDDLVSIGMIGLIKAYSKFDPKKFGGTVTSVMTYAVPMIHGELLRYFRDDHTSGVKFSRDIKVIAKDIYKSGIDLDKQDEIAKELSIPNSKVHDAIQFIKQKNRKSLDEKIGEDENGKITLADIKGIDDDHTTVFVQDFIDRLPTRLKEVIKMRMDGLSQQQIAEKMGVSQVQVCRYLKMIGERYKIFAEGDMTMREGKGSLEVAKKMLKETDLSVKEIAERTGCNKGTVNTYASKIRNKESYMKQELQEKPPVIGEPIVTLKEPYRKDLTPSDYMKKILNGEQITITDEAIKTMLENAMTALGMKPKTTVVSTWTISA